jgi:threonine synthase
VAVPDAALIDAGIRLAAEEGLFVAPEGAACVAAVERLIREGFLKADDRIVIYNTGSGLKYLEAYGAKFPRRTAAASETDKLGGLITPR